MSFLPAGMGGKRYTGTDNKDGAWQYWQRNASEVVERGLERALVSQTMPRVRPNITNTIRTVTPEPLERGEDGSQLASSSLRSESYDPPSAQTSPRSMLGANAMERRQGLVFQDSYSTESLESVRPGPPVSFHSRPRTRTTSGVEEHTRHRSASTSVPKSRHRIGSVHSTNSSSFHNAEPRSAPDSSSSVVFPPISGRPTPPQIQKSNSIKGGRRLVRRSSRPASPFSTTNDIPSVDSFPFPVATGDASKILMLMKTLCGRMRGSVEYQTNEQGSWYSGICYIDDVKASLMYEGEDRCPFHLTVIPDLRGCRVRPIISKERQLRCLEISNRSLGLELHLLPMVEAEHDLWLAALLCWQQIRNGNGNTPAALSATATQPVRERMSTLSRRSSSQNYSSSPSSPTNTKDGNIIKVAKVLLWDKGAPSSPKAIVRRPSARDTQSPTRSWRKVSCTLQDNGEFKLLTENDVTLLSVIQLSQLSRSAIQRLDRSVLDQDHCIAIYPRYTSSSTQLSIFRPVYIALESRLLYEVWFCLLIGFSVPEIYGPSPLEQNSNFEVSSPSQVHTTDDMFRIEKSLNIRIVEAKIRKSNTDKDAARQGRYSVKLEDDPSIREYFTEVVLDGEVRARTTTKSQTRNPFWREDYEFLDLPSHIPRLSVVLKRVESTVPSRIFSSKVFEPEEIVCGTVDVPVDQFERGKDSESWWPILDDMQEPIGEMFLKIRHDELVVLLAKDYEPLSALLHGFASGLTDQIAQYIPSRLRSLSEMLMNIFQVSGHAGDWLMALVEDEIDGSTKEANTTSRLRWSKRIGSNESFHSTSDREQTVRDIGRSLQGEANLLFRGNSLFTQAMDFHMRRVGAEYLRETLSEKVAEINTLNADYEVDPSRMDEEEDASKNWSLLISLTTDVWGSIASSASACPAELRRILKYIRAAAEDRYGDFFRTVSYTSVSGFLFLRFLCPALLNPKLFGLLRDHPQPKAQRTLTLIAKSLQALANMSSFGQKEAWMEPMNRFLSSHRQGLKNFINEVCDLPAERAALSLPASYSTPITILARLPPTSREGFPSLPYLIDHARNFAALVSLWLDSTSHYVNSRTLDGDLAEFNQLCINLQRRTDECLLMAETTDRAVDQMSQSQQWDALVDSLEGTAIEVEATVPNPETDLESPNSPPWSEITTTITATAAPSSPSSELTNKDVDKDKRERLSFWESAFGKESKSQKPQDNGDGFGSSPPSSGPSRNGNNKSTRSFLSGLRRKGSTPGPI